MISMDFEAMKHLENGTRIEHEGNGRKCIIIGIYRLNPNKMTAVDVLYDDSPGERRLTRSLLCMYRVITEEKNEK